MLADAQALPSLRPEITIKWADQGAMLESFSRPQFRDAVVFQPMHWYNEFQLQQSMVKNSPNIHPGDMLIHFAGLTKDKRELMGPWLDRVESLADQWSVPLENTSYLRDVKEFWDTYGHAQDLLSRANNTLTSRLSDIDSVQSVLKASVHLQTMLWEAAEDIEAVRNRTKILAHVLQQAGSHGSVVGDQLRAGTVNAPDSEKEPPRSEDSGTAMTTVETIDADLGGKSSYPLPFR